MARKVAKCNTQTLGGKWTFDRVAVLEGSVSGQNLHTVAPRGVNNCIGRDPGAWVGQDVIHGEFRVGHTKSHGRIALGV